MKRNEGLVTKPMRGALVAGLLAISYVGSVSAALVLPFSQTSGVFVGVTATVTQPGGAPAVAGSGGAGIFKCGVTSIWDSSRYQHCAD